MAKIKYITVEYERGYETFVLLHGMYEEIHKMKVKEGDDESAKVRQRALDKLDELLLYYATRLHIEWTETKKQIENQAQEKGKVNGQSDAKPRTKSK